MRSSSLGLHSGRVEVQSFKRQQQHNPQSIVPKQQWAQFKASAIADEHILKFEDAVAHYEVIFPGQLGK